MAILQRPVDIYFFIYVLLILLTIVTIFKLYQHYKNLEATDYLILFFAFLFIVTGWFILQFLLTYFIALNYQDFVVMILLLVFRPIVFVGFFLLFIHSIRLRGWRNFATTEKIIVFMFYIEIILEVIQDILLGLHIMFVYPEAPFYYFGEDTWYLNLTPLYAIFDNNFAYLSLYLIILGYLVYSYLKVKTPSKFRIISVSRYIWIIFGIVNFVTFAITTNLEFFIPFDDPSYFDAQFDIIFTGFVISLIPLLSLTSFYPEGLLLSEYQILKARKLYEIGEIQSQIYFDRIFRFDYNTRLRRYIGSLPEDVVNQISAK